MRSPSDGEISFEICQGRWGKANEEAQWDSLLVPWENVYPAEKINKPTLERRSSRFSDLFANDAVEEMTNEEEKLFESLRYWTQTIESIDTLHRDLFRSVLSLRWDEHVSPRAVESRLDDLESIDRSVLLTVDRTDGEGWQSPANRNINIVLKMLDCAHTLMSSVVISRKVFVKVCCCIENTKMTWRWKKSDYQNKLLINRMWCCSGDLLKSLKVFDESWRCQIEE